MGIGDIRKMAETSPLLNDPFVEKVWGLINGGSLFEKSPDSLRALRRSLMRESFSFFARRSEGYAQLFERADVDPKSADLEDLARLVIPADMLRGEGHSPFVIDDADKGGEYFMSSGTTGKSPVKVYRSPIDLAIMVKANADLFEYAYGQYLEPGNGTALFMAAPELRKRLSFVAFVELALESKDIELLYGMKMEDLGEGDTPWQKLTPDRQNVVKFLKSKGEPKLFFTAPAGVYLMSKMFETMSITKKIIYKMATRAPPVDLGKGGVVVTGGGSKGFADLPPYDEIAQLSRKYFRASRSDGEVPTPFMDVLGMTETLTALIDNMGTMDKVPHPLSETFLLDPATFEIIEEEGKEGLLCVYNPFVTTWLEAFYPGDLMIAKSSDRYYGKEFVFGRRLTVKDGWDLQRACGGTLEEMMTKE